MKTEIRCIVPKTTSVKPCRSNYPAFAISGRVRSGRWLTYIVLLHNFSLDTWNCWVIQISYENEINSNPILFAGPKLGKINQWSVGHSHFLWTRGRDCMVVGFTTTYAISAYQHWCCEFESRSGRGVQRYVIKFVSDLRQVGGFLRFPPPINLTATM